MLRNDEDKRSLSCINKRHVKYKMYLGRGPFVVTPWIHVVDNY
jgi:hypothetical protein